VTLSGLKAKYASEWPRSNAREAVALAWLRALGVDARPCGHGALEPGEVEGYHTGPWDRFDLYAPGLRLWFEVTGTRWRRQDSARRFSRAVLPVLKAKVDDAERYGIGERLWFVSVNEVEGEVRFLSCAEAKCHPLIAFARGEGEYYGVGWDHWLRPARALAFFAREAVRSG
jgi:hypothetical protein